eukprot:TRINITY_DN59938_c0_g1_i1.p1 TRINITY_DN59938_c0_g1~~TRINITY_DN59938_c0_g1_i1.p1  ORF type:complete len:1026 (-),score=178.52 TRINITY_DN59938_c0_g1_i1:184-3198(-)
MALLVVRSADGESFFASDTVLRESRVLRDLHGAEDGGEEELLLPALCQAEEIEELFKLCAELRPEPSTGGARRPIWRSEAELGKQVRILHCAHYLDCPNVLEALVSDFAAALVSAPSSSAAAERFCAPEWALRPAREWPVEVEALEQRLSFPQGRGNFLGTRAQILTATWVCERSPLSSLPQELCWAILEQAESFCAQELGSTFLVLRDQSLHHGHDVEAALTKLEERRDQLLNSPLAISVAVAWALAPASQPPTRIAALTMLRSVCTFPDTEAFSAFWEIVDPKRPAQSRQAPAVQTVAFKGLPIVTDREDEGQVQAVVDAASATMLHPVAEVRAAAVACLGAVAQDPPSIFRFVTRTSGLDVLLADCDLATRSMEEALENSLQSKNPQVRRAAAESIGVLVDKAGESVAERIVDRLTSERGTLSSCMPELRVSGVLALQHVMCKVRIRQGWIALMTCLRDSFVEVRSAVRLALLALAAIEGCYEVIMSFLQETFNSSGDDVRCMALEIATATTHTKPLGVTSAHASLLVRESLIDQISSVNLHGLRLFCALKGPEDALVSVVSLLKSGDEEHRLEACRALVSISKNVDHEVVAEVAAALMITRPEEQVVEIASTLKHLARSREDTVAASAFAKLVKTRSEPRCIITALKGLEVVAPKGHALARMAALAVVRGGDQDVVEAAVGCLQCICHRGDQDAVAMLVDLVAGGVHQLRPAALKALGVLGLCGDDLVLETIRSRMDHGFWPVRAAALHAFGSLAPHGCPHAISTVQSRLSDTSADVRQIAVEVLVSIAHPREREVSDFLLTIRDDQPTQVQISIDESLDSLLRVGAHSLEEVLPSATSASSGARPSSSTSGMVQVRGYRSDSERIVRIEETEAGSCTVHESIADAQTFKQSVTLEEIVEPFVNNAAALAQTVAISETAASSEVDCKGSREVVKIEAAAAVVLQKTQQHLSPVSSPASAASTAASTPTSRPALRASLREFLVKADQAGTKAPRGLAVSSG